MAITGNSQRKSLAPERANNTQTSDDNISDNDCNDPETKVLLPKHVEETVTSKSNKINFSKLSTEDVAATEEHFQAFLLETARRSDSKVYDIVKLHGKKTNFYPGEIILSQGETGMFVYILVSGCADVLTSDGELVRRLGVGEIFGEISVLFNHPVSANIRAYTDVSVVTIPKKIVKTLMKEAISDVDIIDWCIRRRYLPIGKSVDGARAYRRLTLSVFQGIPIFLSWTEEMIKDLIMSMKGKLVFLYPEKSYIAMEDDPLTSIVILIHGKVELKQGQRTVAKLDIRNTDDPFVFTESILHNDNQLSVVNLQALTNCQIIQVRRDSVVDILNNSPTQRQDFLETSILYELFKTKLKPIYKHYEADLQIEVLVRYLKTSSLYAEADVLDLQRTILKSDPQEYHLGQRINIDTDICEYQSMIIVRGELILMHKKNKDPHIDESTVVEENRSCDSEREQQNTLVIDSNSVPQFDNSAENLKCDSEEHEHLVRYRAGSMMLLKCSDDMILTSKTRCLVLKIHNPVDNVKQTVVETDDIDVERTQSVRDLELV